MEIFPFRYIDDSFSTYRCRDDSRAGSVDKCTARRVD